MTLVSQSELARKVDLPQSRIVRERLSGRLKPTAICAQGRILLFDLTQAKEILKGNQSGHEL